MTRKYSLHKIGFVYTDEWYVPIGIASSVGFYETYEDAQKAQLSYDIDSFRNFQSYDFLRDLMDFYEDKHDETQQKVIEYMQLLGWHENYKKRPYGNDSSSFYWEASLPVGATDEQVAKILELTGASFHKIIEYRDVKEDVYVKMNYEFWGKKAFEKLKEEKTLESRSPFIQGVANKGFYLVTKPAKGRRNARFKSHYDAANLALKIFLECLHEFPENNFLGKNYVAEWSNASFLLMHFLDNCESVVLKAELVSSENKKAIATKLKKIKSLYLLKEGEEYYEIVFPEIENAKPEEIFGLIELLKVKPFEIFTVVTEINGEKVVNYDPDGGTF
ncbi:hypothetical protein [Emticicia soli]|uniref:Uncharacterized protein n=1 Tax=Emticicia soli TaxID=2027878 RepID=A0ABW5J869_9BACT